MSPIGLELAAMESQPDTASIFLGFLTLGLLIGVVLGIYGAEDEK